MYDFLIVGSGLFGAVFAEQVAARGKRVLVIDRREHIAGNCYTEQRHGIEAHVYGPHIFHTNSFAIWDYVRRFGTFNNFVLRPKVNYNGCIYSFPINLFTLYQLWGVTTPQQAEKKLAEVRVKIDKPDNLEDWVLSQVGEEIYYTFIHGYTTKQWRRDPKKLPAAIVRRLPIRLTYDDNYFNDSYQGIPEAGYTALVANMLQGIDVVLGEDYFARRDYWDAKAAQTVFTGCLDQFYEYKYGELDYRTLRFESERIELPDYQGNAVINYTAEHVPYTRVVEHKHFNSVNLPHTYVTHEYPEVWRLGAVPYYPISDAENNAKYAQYAELAKHDTRYIFGGRLAEYKYYDMHQVIGSAIATARTEI
jgi:UDP-galactopyranose mutase